MFYDYPVFFEKNRVWRVYKGGKLFSQFFSDDSEDSNYPEEWVVSSVTALNEGSADPYEGVSTTLSILIKKSFSETETTSACLRKFSTRQSVSPFRLIPIRAFQENISTPPTARRSAGRFWRPVRVRKFTTDSKKAQPLNSSKRLSN